MCGNESVFRHIWYFTNHPKHQFSWSLWTAVLQSSFTGRAWLFCVWFFCSQIKSSMAVVQLSAIELLYVSDWQPCLGVVSGIVSSLPLCLWHQQCALGFLLEALCARLLAALYGVGVCWWRACGHFTCHTHSDHFEPALLQFLALSSKAVDRLWLGQTETSWRIGGSGSVIYRVTQQRDGGLSLNILHRDMRYEKHD